MLLGQSNKRYGPLQPLRGSNREGGAATAEIQTKLSKRLKKHRAHHLYPYVVSTLKPAAYELVDLPYFAPSTVDR